MTLNKIALKTEQKILKLLQEKSGLRIGEIATDLKMRRKSVRNRLRQMRRHLNIVRVRQGQFVLYFPTSIPLLQRTALGLLRIQSVRSVAEQLMKSSSLSPEELASQTGLSRRAIKQAMRKLKRKGLLKYKKMAKSSDYTAHLHPEIRVLMARNKIAGSDPAKENSQKIASSIFLARPQVLKSLQTSLSIKI